MNEINGILLKDLPLQIKTFVGVLLFQEFPVTSLYSDDKGLPIVKEWMDCNEEVDRLFYFKTSKLILNQFIIGKLSQQEFLKNSVDNLIFVSDEKNGEVIDIRIISTSQIPKDYLPSLNSFFQAQNGVQTQKIIEFFGLNDLDLEPININKDFKKRAKEKETETFNTHLTLGQEISNGRVVSDDFKVIGKFRAINCNTGNFTFVSLNEKQFTGFFDKIIRESTAFLTFNKLYEISIERKIIKEAGSQTSKVTDKIIAHYEIAE